MVWSPSRGLCKCPLPPLSSLRPWAGVDHNAILTHCLILPACFLSERRGASGIAVFGLATRSASAMFICCHVRVIESLNVRYSTRETLDSCVNSCLMWTRNGSPKRKRGSYFLHVSAMQNHWTTQKHCDFNPGIYDLVLLLQVVSQECKASRQHCY